MQLRRYRIPHPYGTRNVRIFPKQLLENTHAFTMRSATYDNAISLGEPE